MHPRLRPSSRTSAVEAMGGCTQLIDVVSALSIAPYIVDCTSHSAGTELCFAELKDPIKDKLKRSGLFLQIGKPKAPISVARYCCKLPLQC
jgi:hypothetical protein